MTTAGESLEAQLVVILGQDPAIAHQCDVALAAVVDGMAARRAGRDIQEPAQRITLAIVDLAEICRSRRLPLADACGEKLAAILHLIFMSIAVRSEWARDRRN